MTPLSETPTRSTTPLAVRVLDAFPGGSYALIGLLRPVVGQLLGPEALPFAHSTGLWLIPLRAEQSSYSGLIVFFMIAGLVGLLVWVIHRFASARLGRLI